jgi:hypothetical protein
MLNAGPRVLGKYSKWGNERVREEEEEKEGGKDGRYSPGDIEGGKGGFISMN